jgi:hypothetical protein
MMTVIPDHEGVHVIGAQDGDQRPAEARHPHPQRPRLGVTQLLQAGDMPPRFDHHVPQVGRGLAGPALGGTEVDPLIQSNRAARHSDLAALLAAE